MGSFHAELAEILIKSDVFAGARHTIDQFASPGKSANAAVSQYLFQTLSKIETSRTQ